jgi:hypothetical protein
MKLTRLPGFAALCRLAALVGGWFRRVLRRPAITALDRMKTYVANFKLRLPCPIAVAEPTLPELSFSPSTGHLKLALVRVLPVKGSISEFAVEATYTDPSLSHVVMAGRTEVDGISVVGSAGRLIPPWEIGRILIRPVLYQISATTLQSHVFWDFEDNLAKWVSDFNWRIPDGRILPDMGLEYPGRAIRVLTGAGERQLLRKDWDDLQNALNGQPVSPPPLWRSILAEAHRDRTDDLRNVVIHAATALDVGCQPLLPPNRKFDMSVLRGEGVRTPDLRLTDMPLYQTISRLWFTRHGIVHRGEWQLYDQNPASGATALRPVIPQDVEEFLIAVPKGIAYIEVNPP